MWAHMHIQDSSVQHLSHRGCAADSRRAADREVTEPHCPRLGGTEESCMVWGQERGRMRRSAGTTYLLIRVWRFSYLCEVPFRTAISLDLFMHLNVFENR